MDSTPTERRAPASGIPAVMAAIPDENLRRLKQLADEEKAQQRRNALWARRISIAFAIVLALVLLLSLLRH